MLCKNIVNYLIQATKKQGIAKISKLSDIKKRTLENWVYGEAIPSFANAIKWANGLGLKFNMSKEEMFALMKDFGLIKSAQSSGIKVRTIRGWRYSGVEPPLDKIERIMTAISKPLELVEKEDE